MKRMYAFLSTCLCVFASLQATAWGQNSSLYQRPIAYVAQQNTYESRGEVIPAPIQNNNRGPIDPTVGSPSPNYGGSFANGGPMQAGSESPLIGLQSSWTFIPPVPSRSLKPHDIIQIRVEESTTSLAQGNSTSRKTTSYDAVLKDWIRLVGLDTIKPAPQSDGDPRFQVNQSEVYRGDSNQRTTESLTTNIAAEIVEIRPNGLLVLEARRKIKVNDNTWSLALTGTCQSKDIDPSNVVLSRNLIHLDIDKQDLGHVRDGYSRGWATKLLARLKPF